VFCVSCSLILLHNSEIIGGPASYLHLWNIIKRIPRDASIYVLLGLSNMSAISTKLIFTYDPTYLKQDLNVRVLFCVIEKPRSHKLVRALMGISPLTSHCNLLELAGE
jgi:hypothetical protein